MKRGSTLVELLIAVALASIILLIGSNMVMTFTKMYKNEVNFSRNMFYIKEAAMYIESEIKDNTESLEIVNNKLIIHKKDNSENKNHILREEIFINNRNNLVVVYYKVKNSEGPNNIAISIKSFTCSKEENLIYISIETINGDRIERCLKTDMT